jgi:hypothetical protein
MVTDQRVIEEGPVSPVAASPAPARPVVDVDRVRHTHDDEPAEVTPSEPASFVDDLVDHDDTPAAASAPNGGMFRIGGDESR